jgi:hypothetical protein
MTPTHFVVPAQSLSLAVKYLREHATLLTKAHGLETSAAVVSSLADDIAAVTDLQRPQTLEQQAKVLTEIMGCGPEDESKGNRT